MKPNSTSNTTNECCPYSGAELDSEFGPAALGRIKNRMRLRRYRHSSAAARKYGQLGERPKKVIGSCLVLFFGFVLIARAQVTEVLPTGFDRTWAATLGALSTRTQIQSMDKGNGFLQTKERVMQTGERTISTMIKFAIPPHGVGQAYDAGLEYVTVVLAKKEPKKTSVTVTAHYRTVTQGLTSSANALEWQSRGLTERNVLGWIKAELSRL